MLIVLIDQDFDQLLRRLPDLDAVTTPSIGLSRASDPELLDWAAKAGRVLLTHDAKTMPGHAYSRINAGHNIAGVFIVPRRLPMLQALDDLELLITGTTSNEWENAVFRLPL